MSVAVRQPCNPGRNSQLAIMQAAERPISFLLHGPRMSHATGHSDRRNSRPYPCQFTLCIPIDSNFRSGVGFSYSSDQITLITGGEESTTKS